MPEIYRVYHCNMINVRNKPSLSGIPMIYLNKYEIVDVYEECDGWYKISKTKELWCHKTYLRKCSKLEMILIAINILKKRYF